MLHVFLIQHLFLTIALILTLRKVIATQFLTVRDIVAFFIKRSIARRGKWPSPITVKNYCPISGRVTETEDYSGQRKTGKVNSKR